MNDDKKKSDPIQTLLDRFKLKDSFQQFADISFSWVIFQAPVLLYYLVVVARAAEINVKCAEVSNKFVDAKVVSVFLTFEIEVFAFIGIIAGLWVWLTVKYIANSVYTNGPMLAFKTNKTCNKQQVGATEPCVEL